MAPKYAISGTDPYVVLGMARRFYLDPNVIEEAFRRTAAQHHPDQATGSTASFQELQEAAIILRDPAKRLRFLAGIPEPRSLPLPPAAMELFPLVTDCLQKSESFAKKYQSASGALTKALLSEELLQERLALQQTLQQVEKWESSLQQQLQSWDASLAQPSLEELLELANQFTFAQRWLQQLRERELLLKTVIR